MGKQITFTYKGETYVLEYTRRTVQNMERRGFLASDVLEKPVSMVPELFYGAFMANHRFVKRETVDEIFAAMPDKTRLLTVLIELYHAPIDELLGDPEEDEEKNVEWTANW